jgi:ubiquitin-like protein Pup
MVRIWLKELESRKPQLSVQADSVEAKVSSKGEKLKADLDDLLDEIDEVLETNAEDFVKSYVQKGGQ